MSSRSAQVTVVKPHYKAIATPVISLLSSFVTRPGDREGAGRRRDTWIVRASDTWLTDRRGQTGRSGGQASLPSLLNVAIPPSSKHHPHLCSPHTSLRPMRPPSKRLCRVLGAPDDLCPSSKVSLHDLPSGEVRSGSCLGSHSPSG